MNYVDILFTISNGVFLIASYPMLKAAIKNKESLIGFSKKGAILTSVGMFITIIALIFINSYIGAIIAIPTLIYWTLVSIYSKGN